MKGERIFERVYTEDCGVYMDFFTCVDCGLYYTLKGEVRRCEYRQKTKCERCPVYNGFNGNERFKPLLQKLLLGE